MAQIAQMTSHSNALGAAFAVVVSFVGCAPRAVEPAPAAPKQPSVVEAPPETAPSDRFAESPHVALGLPTRADSRDELLFDRDVFVGSYSRAHAGPNWIAWRLVAEDLGDAPRTSSFRADRALLGIEPVAADAFSGSGWDRGHLCPSEDRTATREANRATFVMSNVLPQEPSMNRGSWARLEAHTRELASNGRVVHVVAGAVWSSDAERVGRSTIPEKLFKVVVATQTGDARDVTEEARVIAVLVLNDGSTKGQPWTSHRTSVGAIEDATGYDLLSSLADPVEQAIEARVDE